VQELAQGGGPSLFNAFLCRSVTGADRRLSNNEILISCNFGELIKFGIIAPFTHFADKDLLVTNLHGFAQRWHSFCGLFVANAVTDQQRRDKYG
jgi:hypothetical protein